LLLLKGPMPACIIGYLIPTRSHTLDLIIEPPAHIFVLTLHISTCFSQGAMAKLCYFSNHCAG
jgi:hypothetical protein